MNEKKIPHPSPEGIQNWMWDSNPYMIDAVMEYLHDMGLLNKKGEKLAHGFWKKYIKNGGISGKKGKNN